MLLRTPVHEFPAPPPPRSRSSSTHLTARGEISLALDLLALHSISPACRSVWINSGDGDADDITAHVVRLGARLEF